MLIKTVVTFFLATLAFVHAQPVKSAKQVIQTVTSTLEDLQAKYGKRYKSEEEKVFRRVILERNKRTINEHNKKAGMSYNLGEN